MIRIALALTCLVQCVFFSAHSVGLLPNAQQSVLEMRGKWCEEVALECASRMQKGDDTDVRTYLQSFQKRRAEVISIGLRGADKSLAFDTGGHAEHWPSAPSTGTVSVPLYLTGDQPWGQLEVAFHPHHAGWFGLDPFWIAALFFAVFTFAGIYGYLRLAHRLSGKNSAAAQRVRDMLNTVAEGVLILDKEQRITLANDTFAAKVGVPAAELGGLKVDALPWRMSLPAGSSPKSRGEKDETPTSMPWHKTIASRQVEIGALVTLSHPQGAFNFSVNSSPVMDNQDDCKGVLVTFDDLTLVENKNSQLQQSLRKLKTSRQKIQHQAKDLKKAKVIAETANRAKTNFLASISHEIRTPMNTILGMTDLALEMDLPAEQKECFEMVKVSADSLLGLINDLLDLSKAEAGKFTLEHIPFSFQQTITDALKFMAVRAQGKELEMLCDIRADVPDHLIGDPTRLRQILINLVGNALKFTTRGHILVRVDREEITNLESGMCLHFRVQDTGVGIAPDKLQAIFEPFVQADGTTTRKYGGTGLGLAICRQMVEMMQGSIWVESTPGKGSIFHFLAHFGCDPHDAESASLYPSDMRALVVDDNPVSLEILARLLEARGIQVQALNKSLKAVSEFKRAEAAGAPYHLVVLDGHMPNISGFDIARAIREFEQDSARVPVLLLLDSTQRREDLSQCRQFDSLVPVAKPVTGIVLDAALQAVRRLTCPIATLDAGQEGQVQTPAVSPLRILLVDDNAFNIKVGVMKLTRHGHRVETASSGPEALAALQRDTFDLLLLDLQMPEMDGNEVARRIRQAETGCPQRLPIIAMTAHALDEIYAMCMESGMDGYVTKPIRDEQLWSEIRRVLPTKVSRIIDPVEDRDELAVPASSPIGTGVRDKGCVVPKGDSILARVGGDRAFLKGLWSTFRTDAADLLTEIRSGITEKNSARLRIAVHTLKGMLGFFEADEAIGILSKLSESMQADAWDGMDNLLVALDRDIQIVNANVAQLCDLEEEAL